MNQRLFYSSALAVIATLALVMFAACNPTTQTNTNTQTNSAPANAQTSNTNYNDMGHANMNHGNMNHTGMDHANMQSSPDAAQAPYDLQFIDTMIAHHQGAVDMARPAVTKAQHADLKEFARKIVEDQEREINQMKRRREQWFAGRTQAVNMEMPGMRDSMKGMDMNMLNNATGNAYDLMFIEQMIPHHEGAISMAREALQRAENAELKQLAEAIITAQEREIRQMNEWKQAWRQ